MRSLPRLLVVDADTVVAATRCRRLAREGFLAESASTAAGLRERLDAHTYALIVLDLGVPGVDASALVQAPRGLITLSAHAGAVERVISLEQGADDCLGQPVHPQELVARIRSVLRSRARGGVPLPAGRTTRFDGWELRRVPRRLTSPSGAPVALSDAEYALLTAFLDAPREVLSRAQWRARLDGSMPATPHCRIDLLVSRLRRKLGAAGSIRTVRGAGYRLDIQSLDG